MTLYSVPFHRHGRGQSRNLRVLKLPLLLLLM